MKEKNKKSIVNRQLSAVKNGFSLMELIIAIFIFSLVMTASVGIFSAVIKGYRHAKVIQRDLEDAQYAMNIMAKTIRTSNIVKCGEWDCAAVGTYDAIKIFDYSQKKCIEYKITGAQLTENSENADPNLSDSEKIAWCKDTWTPDINNVNILVADINWGKFYVRPEITDPLPGDDKQVARITVALKICPNGICSAGVNDAAVIQSTVSLRPSETEYKEVGL